MLIPRAIIFKDLGVFRLAHEIYALHDDYAVSKAQNISSAIMKILLHIIPQKVGKSVKCIYS